MLRATFQSPSITIDSYYKLCDSVTQSVIEGEELKEMLDASVMPEAIAA